MSLLELFCDVDDFWLDFEPQWKASRLAGGKQRERTGQLCLSEVMTILIHFHQSHYRTFKAYYREHVQVHLTKEFPHLVSYPRFVALIPQMMLPLLAYLQTRYGACTGISFIDSTSLEVCDPKRISQHRVFAADAKRGKSSMGWFYGFKLHLAVNDQGELLACCLTPGNVDDRKPVPSMVKKLRGKLFGDRGYISAPLTRLLFEQGLQLITRLRKNMKNQLMQLSDKLLLRKRANTLVDYRPAQEYFANRAFSSS
jgi:Transposase DDE domain